MVALQISAYNHVLHYKFRREILFCTTIKAMANEIALQIRVTREQKGKLEEAAKAAGTNFSAWARGAMEAVATFGVPSEKPNSGGIVLPVDEEQSARISRAAKRDGKSVSEWLIGLAEREIAPPGAPMAAGVLAGVQREVEQLPAIQGTPRERIVVKDYIAADGSKMVTMYPSGSGIPDQVHVPSPVVMVNPTTLKSTQHLYNSAAPPIMSGPYQNAAPMPSRPTPPPPDRYGWEARFKRWAERDQAGAVERHEYLLQAGVGVRVLAMPPDKQLTWCRYNMPDGPERQEAPVIVDHWPAMLRDLRAIPDKAEATRIFKAIIGQTPLHIEWRTWTDEQRAKYLAEVRPLGREEYEQWNTKRL